LEYADIGCVLVSGKPARRVAQRIYSTTLASGACFSAVDGEAMALCR
jgi:hypothetical protein